MADEQKNPSNNNNNKSSSSSFSSKEKMKKVSSSGEIPIGGSKGGSAGSSSSSFSGHSYPNQREASIPDAATLRDQWKFAIRQYSKRSSQAWGAAIFAGASIYALGWIIKGSNPIPSKKQQPQQQQQNQEDDEHK